MMKFLELFSQKDVLPKDAYFKNCIREVLTKMMTYAYDPKVEQEYSVHMDFIGINFHSGSLFMQITEYKRSFREICKSFELDRSSLNLENISDIFEKNGLTKRLKSTVGARFGSFKDFPKDVSVFDDFCSNINNLECGVPYTYFNVDVFNRLFLKEFKSLVTNQTEYFHKMSAVRSISSSTKAPKKLDLFEVEKFFSEFKVIIRGNDAIDISTAFYASPSFNKKCFPLTEKLKEDLALLQNIMNNFKIYNIPKIEDDLKKTKRVRRNLG